MTDIVIQYKNNPLLSPKDLKPSNEYKIIECLLNPEIFEFKRVAKRTDRKEGIFSVGGKSEVQFGVNGQYQF